MVHRKILVYGFRPYGPYTTNITEAVIKRLPQMPDVALHVFDVRFDSRMFADYFNRVGPAIIIGMGQHPRARKLRIERKCQNVMKYVDGIHRPIDPGGPSTRFSNLALPHSQDTTVTYDAGDYVCNYSMYMAGGYCHVNGGCFGFLHVPRQYDADRLLQYLDSLIKARAMGGRGDSVRF